MWNPQILLYAMMGGFGIVLMSIWWWRRRGSGGPWHCQGCGRDLRGLRLHADPQGQTRCPLCGERFNPPMRIVK